MGSNVHLFAGEDFKFLGRSNADPGNFSDWKDNVNDDIVVFRKGERILSWAEVAADNGDRNLSMRLELHLIDASSVMIYLTRVPLNMDELEEISEKWEVSKDSNKIPVVTCKVGSLPDQKDHGLVAKLFVKEPSSHKAGMGIYPLLEQVLFYVTSTNLYRFDL